MNSKYSSRKTPPQAGASATDARAMDGLLDELASSDSSVALISGAGASKAFGYPLTRELMLRIFADLQRASWKNGSKEKRELYDFLCDLLPGERLSEEKVPLVTGVLSLLDYALSTGQGILPGRTLEETRRARELLERAVMEAIPDWEWFSDDEKDRFDGYCSWLKSLRRARPDAGVGLITTNYDMLADIAALKTAEVKGTYGRWNIEDMGHKVDFGFRWVRPDIDDEETSVGRPEDASIALYKLHGSTNWLRCPLCENLYINPNGPISWVVKDKKASAANCCHCSDTRLQAQIVSPSFVRQMREPNLIAVWKNALDFLRESDYWIMIGYSFPDEDVAVRALFTRAFRSRKQPPHIRVIQSNRDAEINYESFFQSGTLRYLTGGLELLLERRRTRAKNGAKAPARVARRSRHRRSADAPAALAR